MAGVYQPRSRGAAMSDALAEARIALARLTQLVIMRGAGLLVLLATLAVGLSLASYSPGDPSLNNATGRAVSNWLGPLGATAADVLLQAFGIAALAFLAPLAVWGARAVLGKGLSRAVWRGHRLADRDCARRGRPRLAAEPAGPACRMGGWIGIAAASLSEHAGQFYGQRWLGVALPLLLLIAGLPLAFIATGLRFSAFIATGLRFSKMARGVATGAAALYWLGGKVKLPARRAAVVHDYDEEDEEPESDEREDDSYALDIAPEPLAATKLAERRETRIKREEARRAVAPAQAQQAARALSRLQRISIAVARPS